MIAYLWKNRSRPAIGSAKWAKYWGKRVVTSLVLMRLVIRVTRLRLRGATIGTVTVLSPVTVNGRLGHLRIGNHSAIGRVILNLHDDVTIGDHVVINDQVVLLTASHDVSCRGWGTVTKPIVIEDYAWVASGVIVLPGVRIGRGAVAGAGAVIAKDVPPYCIAVGNPARILSARRPADLNYSPTALAACFEAWLGREKLRLPPQASRCR